jgi:prepilin-type N-terminal cleavage/methylation domain-containing protein
MINREKGFTLLETLVVMAIIGTLTGIFIRNFSRGRLDLERAMNQMVFDIRDAQSKAINATHHGGSLRCGFGITYISQTSYRIYSSPVAHDNCVTQSRNYDESTDPTLRDATLPLGVIIEAEFPDFFFEPPDPKTFLDDNPDAVDPITIVLKTTGASCGLTPEQCREVCIYSSSRIDAGTIGTCP